MAQKILSHHSRENDRHFPIALHISSYESADSNFIGSTIRWAACWYKQVGVFTCLFLKTSYAVNLWQEQSCPPLALGKIVPSWPHFGIPLTTSPLFTTSPSQYCQYIWCMCLYFSGDGYNSGEKYVGLLDKLEWVSFTQTVLSAYHIIHFSG